MHVKGRGYSFLLFSLSLLMVSFILVKYTKHNSQKFSGIKNTYCGTAIIIIYPRHPFIFHNCVLNYVTMPSLPLPHSPDQPSFYSLNVYSGYLASEWNHTSFVLLYIYIMLIFTLFILYSYYSYINFS